MENSIIQNIDQKMVKTIDALKKILYLLKQVEQTRIY